MCRKYFRVIVVLLLLIEFCFVFLSVKSFSNKNVTEIKETSEVNKEMFSMYVENKDGEYEEYTDSEIFPIGLKYYFNLERSNCIDNKGKIVTDVISYNNNKITVSSNKTLFCYLYFDLDKVAPQTFTFYLGGSSNPEYITSPSTTVYLSWTDTDITSYCINTENDSSTCSWIDTSGNEVSVSYTISTQGSQTRYAFIRDAAENISPVVSDSVFLDSVAPVITSASDSGVGTANVVVTETGSGVSHVCVNTSKSSTTGCIWDEVSGTTFTSATVVTTTGNYYIHVKDKAGNIGHKTSTISIAAPPMNLKLLCSSYTNMGTCMASEYGSSDMMEISNFSTTELGGMYRYQGPATNVTNNYICFGTNNKSTCTSNTEKYMYRIIGISEEGKLKLIKKEPINGNTTYAWHKTEEEAIWANSDIYKGLNGISGGGYSNLFVNNSNYDYMSTSSVWYNKISNTSWKYGAISNYTLANVTPDEIYTLENDFTNSLNDKIGLMYIHDYYYQHGSSCYKNSNCMYSWIFLLNNFDGSMGYELLINYGASISSGVYFEFDVPKYSAGKVYSSWGIYVADGGVYTASYYVNGASSGSGLARPVFYLNNVIKITGGSGTIDNPYIID